MEIALLHRKESLVLTAVEVLNELGVQGLSTREIAKRQGVSEATLFRHFKNKNELLLAVLEHYSQYDSDIAASTRLKLKKPKEAIMFYVTAYVEYYENYPAITAITQAYDVLSCDPGLGEKIKSIFLSRLSFIKELVEEAQKAGEIPESLDAEKFADVILGLIRSICLKWRLNGFSFSLKEYSLRTLQMILDASNTK
jgi:AcrR family transcriptional regulator